MNLSTKIMATLGVALMALFLALYTVSTRVVQKGFTELEDDYMRRNVERVLRAIEGRGQDLDTSVTDWARWDDTYSFVQDRNEAHIKANLTPEAFKGLNIHALLFVDASRKVVWAESFDLSEEPKEMPMPAGLVHLAQTGLPLTDFGPKRERIFGVVLLDEGPMVVAARPIMTSKNEGPPHGVLIMGRYLDAAAIKGLSEALQLDISAFPVNALPPDRPWMGETLTALSSGELSTIRVLSEKTIAGYGLVRDLNAKPAMVIEVKRPRDIFEQGRRTTSFFTSMLILAGGLFGLAVVFMLRRQIIARLECLSRDIGRISTTEDFSQRVSLRGSDELSVVADNINRMLTAVEESRLALTESEGRYRAFINSTEDMVFIKDNSLRYELVNVANMRFFDRPMEDILGHDDYDLMPRDAADACRESDKKAVADRQVVVNVEKVGERYYETRKFPVLLKGDRVGIGGIARDITDRKRMDEVLRQSRESLQQILDSVSFGVIIIGKDKIVRHANRVAVGMAGFESEEEMLGLICHRNLCPAETDKCPILDLDQTVDRSERVLLTRKGGKIPILKSVVPILLNGEEVLLESFMDITERKRAEDTVRESEGRYRNLFNNMFEAFAYCRMISAENEPIDFEYVDVNSVFEEMLGARHLIGRRVSEVQPERDKWNMELVRTYAEVARTGKPVKLEAYSQLLEKWLSASVYCPEKGCFAVTYENITERRLAEEALRESEERYRTLFSRIQDGVYRSTNEGRFVDVNPAMAEMFGYDSREEMLAVDIEKDLYFAPEDRAVLSLDTGQEIVEIFRMRRKNGSEIWVEDHGLYTRDRHGNILFHEGILRDVTERRLAEQALRESEERYRTLFTRILDGVYRSTHEGEFLDVNPAMVTMFGYDSREEMLAIDIKKALYFAPEDRAKVFSDTRREKVEVFRMRRKDGAEIWVEDHGHYVRDPDGNVAFHEGILRDVTERKKAEEEKEKLRAQLNQSQKIESVGRLAGGVAHDFNNMLGVILGHAELAMRQVDPATPLHDDLEEIQKAAQYSADLTRQLLAFARKQTVSPKVLDLNDTVASMLKMLQRLIGEDIELVWRPATGLWPVKIDPAQVDQILANLSVNARDAIAGTGNLTIETGNVVLDATYCQIHEGFRPGDYVLLAVSDTGAGMDKATMDRLFEPFFTTKELGKGTGLGLATIYGAVKQNQGFINVYSEPGRGTSFKIYLPRAEAVEAAAVESVEKPAYGTETVLVAEDEKAILDLSKTILEHYGYTVLAARTPAEALALSERHQGPIHLLVTDVVLPGINGKELRDRLTVLRPEIKALFMSGYTANVIAHHGVIDEGIEFLQKPFSVNTLTQKVRELLDRP